MAELEDDLSAREVLETVLAEGLQRRVGRQPVARQIARDLGHQCLPAVADGKQTRHVVERRPEVVAVAHFRRAGMQRHSGVDRGLVRPTLRTKRTLRGERGLERVHRGREGGTECIANRLEHVAAVRLDALAQQRVVARKRHLHCIVLGRP